MILDFNITAMENITLSPEYLGTSMSSRVGDTLQDRHPILFNLYNMTKNFKNETGGYIQASGLIGNIFILAVRQVIFEFLK